MPASSSSAKQSGGQNLIPDRLPDGFACSSGTAPAPRGRRAATRFRAPVNSPSSQSPFSRHSPAAYQGNKSLTRADTDRTIPSTTTYSSTQATESLSRQTAADGAASPSGQNVSPWVQHLNSEENAASPSPEESVRRTRRPLWARILRKLFPRGRGVGGGARPGGIKRLWQRVRPRRRGAKPAGPPETAPRRTTAKPARPPHGPNQPSGRNRPTNFTPAVRTESWGLGRKKKKEKIVTEGQQQQRHGTARGATCETLLPENDERARHQPLVGAANSVFMAASATGAGGGGGGGF
ncbi:hypothetical protein NKR19_g2482 [Coniochaeta hoffmannii]|uniref:Uncharacterized protein n=1 Tax=Coniochaeta hoffmannii TaxID=91930 RepID=A0AA38SGF3_9PEZI|nr:hypothetical protein NKR19_g2482 [Coniochaeta hoffmannii]